MNKFILSAVSHFLLLSLFFSSISFSSTARADTLLIKNITLIDPVDGEIPAQDLLIQGDKIVQIAPTGSLEDTAGITKTIDGDGKYLIPALWDSHVHVTANPGIGLAAMPLFVANGITRIRDTGGLLEELVKFTAAAASMGTTAPDIYFSGPLIDGLPTVYDGHTTKVPRIPRMAEGITSIKEAERLVNELADAGAHFIKSYEMLKPEVFRAVVAQATQRGLPVAAHIPLSMSVEQVIQAGVKDLQHLRNISYGCSSKRKELLLKRQAMLLNSDNKPGYALRSSIHAFQRPVALAAQDNDHCNKLIKSLADNGIFQTPTIMTLSQLISKQFLTPEWRATYRYLPAPVATQWKALGAKLAARTVNPDLQAYFAWFLAMINKMNLAGVPIMAGTDMPVNLLVPGFSLHQELQMLVQAGLTEQEALYAATVSPAEFFGLEDKMGTISVGKSSELVLLTANPLNNISNTSAIEAVIRRGDVLDREALNTLLKNGDLGRM